LLEIRLLEIRLLEIRLLEIRLLEIRLLKNTFGPKRQEVERLKQVPAEGLRDDWYC
jgi:hypothetical protein